MGDSSRMYEEEAKKARHGDFAKVEASRQDWDGENEWHMTKTKMPGWKYGDGGNDGGASLNKNHVDIDPNAEDRTPGMNYKLLISAIVPRPVGFLSTRSKDGQSTNLAPFSYFQVVNNDPPLFIVGFAGNIENAKDSLRNLLDTKECVLNIISEHYIEASNIASINAPFGVSEWALSGLHPEPCKTVSCDRVKEAVFAVEGQLVNHQEYSSKRDPSRKTGVVATIEGTRFWVREDAFSDNRETIKPEVLRPVARMGGITYGRVTEGYELPRPVFDNVKELPEVQSRIKSKVDGQ